MPHPTSSSRPAEFIRLRGVRQNNLKGFDLDLPLGKLIVVTGLSGAGKSSLVFETLHAEGQRRYVETFSAYTRQFLDLLAKPRVDSIENIRPSIAIEQTNTIRTSRSTVGTMTELCDFFKVWFSHRAACFDPDTGAPVEDDTPGRIWEKISPRLKGETAVLSFPLQRPDNLSWTEIIASLSKQGYTRLVTAEGELCRLEEFAPAADSPNAAQIQVVQDRVRVDRAGRTRFLEAAETALHFGQGSCSVWNQAAGNTAWSQAGLFSRGLHCPETGRRFRPAVPALFSFNSPLGACPSCRGFGRVIEIDYRLAIPDTGMSLADGAIKPWEGDVYGESKQDLFRFAKKLKIPTHLPFRELTPQQQAFVIEGEPGYGEEDKEWPAAWYGLKGFFRYLESKTYKMHVRVFLSRYRAYNLCPHCRGARLQPEALCWRWNGHRLPDLYAKPVAELIPLLETDPDGPPPDHPAGVALASILTRLRYLEQVGLGYLNLDRASRTLSGGEVERVNLTACLGTSLVDTLFVLDEPSVGLHARDIERLIEIIRTLTRAGNTVVVVEHDEAMIRAADQVIEVGPEAGSAGGHIVFQGTVGQMVRAPRSITGAYLSGRQRFPAPSARRTLEGAPRLLFRGVSKHNLRNIDVSLPLGRLAALSGVSGSGKSTLLDHVIYQGLLNRRGMLTEDPAQISSIECEAEPAEVVLVDQSPVSRTPRSNPALYIEAWEGIRELFASTEAAREAGFSASTFSFNSGDGRCEHCQGLGYERVEMQFLSDVFLPCAACDGKRFKEDVLAITWAGQTVHEVLGLTVRQARESFREEPDIHRRLGALAEVGLDYLTLGQPLNTLSGGEAQRLKLVKYLGDLQADKRRAPGGSALLLLDEPTTGLHRHDVKRLVSVLQRLVDGGHSVVVIEHNLDVLKSADWILEVGPEAGEGGGRIVAEGTPEEIAAAGAVTSPYLAAALADRIRATSSARPTRSAAVRPTELVVTGARENNLKDIEVRIPYRQMTVVTGVSGSGKSTLAFDIIFAEGQRRFMESMSPYARQFVEQMPKPSVDRLTGIPPTVAIEQRVTRGTRKSTVATVTEVAQFLRLLYARVGVQHHPDTGQPVVPLSFEAVLQLLRQVLSTPRAANAKHLYLCAPLIRGRKGHHQPVAAWLARQGYERMRVDGRLLRTESFSKLDRYREHDIEAVVADFAEAPAAPRSPAYTKWLDRTLETALRLGKGSCFLLHPDGTLLSWFSTTRTDIATGESFPELDPKHFSFNSPRGWCAACRGHGRIYPWMSDEPDEDRGLRVLRESGLLSEEEASEEGADCPSCGGERLNRLSRAVRLPFAGGEDLSIPDLLRLAPAQMLERLRQLKLDRRGVAIARDLLPEIESRLRFMDEVGLGYLALDRPTDSLSGGEAQRIRLAAQLGSNLSGVLYVLDEPSIGLHARDNERLIGTLERLREKGNTLLVVEHDEATLKHADQVIDLGPGAGIHGGRVLANGSLSALRKIAESVTGACLRRSMRHPLRGSYRELPAAAGRGGKEAWLTLTGARLRNLQNVDLRVPLGRLTLVCGPSGAGKSTLFRDLLPSAVAVAVREGRPCVRGSQCDPKRLAGNGRGSRKAVFDELRNGHRFKAVIEVDQSPIGKTPRSTPATYLGIFDVIRKFYASLPEAKVHGYAAGRFSFNTPGGRCETCQGAGRVKLEMNFLPDTYLACEGCSGSRYGAELDEVTWKGKSIGEVLKLTFEEAAEFFSFHSGLAEICRLMQETGLGYLTLGQSSPTLSGGEAQRLKLVTELARGLQTYRERSRGLRPANLYILEEPTIGLHLSDCEKLIGLLHRLVDQGHTVIVIEHHTDLIAEGDYVVELGPDGGPSGGRILFQGPVAGILACRESPTAPHLKGKLRSSVTSAGQKLRRPAEPS